MEFFSGSAGLSFEVRRAGFNVLAVDHDRNRHRPKVAQVSLDLTSDDSQGIALQMLRRIRPLAVHLGLPCGTCSRAREKPLPKHLQQNHSDPKPLRDAQNLLGFPGLSGADKMKVEQANKLYEFGVQVLLLCFELGILASVENPTRSWLWGILTCLAMQTGNKEFIQWFAALKKVDFHACMHGSERDKKTRLLASLGLYDSLGIQCDHTHAHKPRHITSRGQHLEFATALEAEYPRLLCQRMAQCLVHAAEDAQVKLEAQITSAQHARHAWGTQTSRSKPLFCQFKKFVHLEEAISSPNHVLLASPLTGGQQTEMQQEVDQPDRPDANPKRARKRFKYGVQWDPAEFLEQAKQLKHPKDPQLALPLVLKEAMIHVLSNDPLDVAKHRLQVVLAVHRQAHECKERERAFKETMEPMVSSVLETKNLSLWKQLLETTQFSDMEVVNLVAGGIPLSGSHSKPPNFPDDWKPATVSAEELLSSAVWRRKVLMGASSKTEFDGAQQDDLHAATMKEVDLGHLFGPYSEAEMTEFFGTDRWLYNPRFILYQGEERKVRAIDDCKRSGLNESFTTVFKLELYDVDTLACLLAALSDSLAKGVVEMDMDDESMCQVAVHPKVMNDNWLGRTLDLSRAYKQLAISPESRSSNVIGYWYKDRWLFFRSNVLPFGATAAVYSFNRVSRSLHHLLCKLLWCPCTCFYDDFPTVSPSSSASVLTKALTAILNLLGWDHAQVGAKALDFAADFNALGISVQLQQLHRGSFVLANKEGRIDRICRMLGQVEHDGTISKSRAAEVQGHLNFAGGFYTSKALKFLVSSFSRLADLPKSMSSQDLTLLCRLARSMLGAMPPRRYDAHSFTDPYLIFTDGAWESERASAGAVVYNPCTSETRVFEVLIPDALVELWMKDVGDQIICQIEMFTYVTVRYKLRTQLLNKVGISWIDNDAARFAILKGTSDSFSLRAMCRVNQQIELESPSSIWYERVSSYSNPSDGPSRKLVAQTAALLGAIPDDAWVTPQHVIQAIMDLHSKPLSLLYALTNGGQPPVRSN